MPTRRGRALLAAGAALYVLARIASVRELYAVAVAALVLPLAAVAFVRSSRHRLQFARAVGPQRIFAGQGFRVRIVVRNLARAGSPPLVVEDAMPSALGGAVRLALAPVRGNEREAFSVDRRAGARGRFAIGPMRARLRDPFGLAEISSEVGPRASVVVYPAIERLLERSPAEAQAGAGRSVATRVRPHGDEFYALREYQEGDDLRKIHWRSTARRDELMIRQDEVRLFPRATILLDNRAMLRDPRGDVLEWSVSTAASIVWELARQGFSLRLVTADTPPGPSLWGREAVDPLLTTLAVTGRSAARTLLPVVRRLAARPGAGGALFAILPPSAPDLLASLSRLARAYEWRGAVLLDVASFTAATARERAAADQRLADVERTLARAGWRVAVAGHTDRFGELWLELMARGASRPSSPSRRS